MLKKTVLKQFQVSGFRFQVSGFAFEIPHSPFVKGGMGDLRAFRYSTSPFLSGTGNSL
jgi:hypothetical protein